MGQYIKIIITPYVHNHLPPFNVVLLLGLTFKLTCLFHQSLFPQLRQVETEWGKKNIFVEKWQTIGREVKFNILFDLFGNLRTSSKGHTA